jgi:hypothetical protein
MTESRVNQVCGTGELGTGYKARILGSLLNHRERRFRLTDFFNSVQRLPRESVAKCEYDVDLSFDFNWLAVHKVWPICPLADCVDSWFV